MSQENNKRIAKNTLMLYVRMLVMLVLSLFTSRVTLNALGIVDYGIYNVVGGVVAMFGFINASMSSATQRYITFALGKGDAQRLKTVFSTTIQIHFLIGLLIVLLSETAGLWFFYTQMNIPAERMDAAFWVLQLSVAGAFVGIVSVPYNADIVAHEKMSAFASLSILDVVFKLLIVYLLLTCECDKLLLFATFLFCTSLLMRYIYTSYCHRHFPESRYSRVWDKPLFREMLSFATWSLFGNLSAMFFGTGLNMLLNVFFGPVANAARAIAGQVENVIKQFVGNFQMALNPQITKNYAQGNLAEMHKLMFRSARFSFFLLFFLALPVIYETNFVLVTWLKTVPDDTVIFFRITICTSLIYTIANPMIIANQATGKVKKYQAVCGSTLLLILPISYVFLKLGFPAYSVFIVHFVMEGVCQIARMTMLRPLIGLRLRDYFTHIYIRVAIVVAVSVLLPGMVHFSMQEGILRFIAVGFTCVLSVSSTAYLLGLTANERVFVRTKTVVAWNKFIRKKQ